MEKAEPAIRKQCLVRLEDTCDWVLSSFPLESSSPSDDTESEPQDPTNTTRGSDTADTRDNTEENDNEDRTITVNANVGHWHSTMFPLSKDFGIDALIAERHYFLTFISSLELHIQKKFNTEESRQMTDFFFDDLIGLKAQQRMQTILAEHNEHVIKSTCSGHGKETAKAMVANLPLPISAFATGLQAFRKSQDKPHSLYASLRRTGDHFKFIRSWDTLNNLVKNGDVELRNFLKSHCRGMRSGAAWISVLKKYLSEEFHFDTRRESNFQPTIQNMIAPSALANEF
jgi:hypothetical protein